MRRQITGVAAAAVALLLASAAASAQTNERIYEDLDFRFVTPGARAVGMGKTFIGLADDATAAASNPAGMSNLLEQEFSVEFIGTQIKHRRLSPTADGVDFHTFGDYVVTPSFLSYVAPIKRLTVSFFLRSVQDYRETFGFDGRFIEQFQFFEDGAWGDIAVESDSYGVSGAFVAHPKLSIGGSLTYSTLSVATQARSGAPAFANGIFRRINPRNGSDTIDSDETWSGSVGVLVKPWSTLSLGATYHRRTTFNVQTTLFGEFLFCCDGDNPSRNRTGQTHTVDYVLPSRYGVGASWRPLPQFTVLSDWQHINYSERVTSNFLIVDLNDPAAGLADGEFTRRCVQPCPFSMPDVSEWHAGAEYRWYASKFTMAFRGGFFTDPDHQLRYQGGINLQNPTTDPAIQDRILLGDQLFSFRFNSVTPETRLAWTAGWGLALANRWQTDIAASFADDATEIVVSMVVRLR